MVCPDQMYSTSLAGHPDVRRCTALTYGRYAWLSRLTPRTPRVGIRYTSDQDRPLGRVDRLVHG